MISIIKYLNENDEMFDKVAFVAAKHLASDRGGTLSGIEQRVADSGGRDTAKGIVKLWSKRDSLRDSLERLPKDQIRTLKNKYE